MRQKSRKHKKAKTYNREQDWTNFKIIRNEVIDLIREAKEKYFNKLQKDLSDKSTHPRKWWNIAKSIAKINNKPSSNPLKVNDNILIHPRDKSEAFNNFFTSIASDITNINLPELPPLCPFELSEIIVTEQDLKDQFSLLNTNKPAGPDGILPKVIKNLSSSLIYPLKMLFNRTLTKGEIPDILKTACVNALYKGKGEISDLNNYRPIAITSVFIKMLERIIFKYTYNYIMKYQLLSENQSGFQPRDSTVNQLVDIFNTISSNLDKGNDLRFVFCDISKAFDRVWHLGLLYKLRKFGIKGKLLEWFKAYLSDRKQSVVIDGYQSNTKLINAGVPQGSVLGPFLFLLFINDITDNITSNIKLFADDTSLYIVIDSENDIEAAANILNDDLSSISSWANLWQILFNPNKTVAVNFTRKQTDLHPPLLFNNHPVMQHDCHKHLGLTFNKKGTWSDHISTIYKNASSRLNILRMLKHKVDRNTLKTLYISYIRPILEYSDVVWDNCSKKDSDLIESVQLEAMRLITGLRRGTSHHLLYSETQLETFETRRHNHKLTLMFKIINKYTPTYLYNIIQPFINTNINYAFRNERIFSSFCTN